MINISTRIIIKTRCSTRTWVCTKNTCNRLSVPGWLISGMCSNLHHRVYQTHAPSTCIKNMYQNVPKSYQILYKRYEPESVPNIIQQLCHSIYIKIIPKMTGSTSVPKPNTSECISETYQRLCTKVSTRECSANMYQNSCTKGGKRFVFPYPWLACTGLGRW